MKNYHNFNFFKHTYCEFKIANEDFFKEKSSHFKSKSGSRYFYTEVGVYRYSNHWGRVANCRWKIHGVEEYKNQNYYIGYANWLDFYSLNSSEKKFYLEVDYKEENVTIRATSLEGDSVPYLMSLSVAFKRIKEIKILFKEYKWSSYFNENIDVLRKELINNLISSDETIQVLRQNLKNKNKESFKEFCVISKSVAKRMAI